MTRLITSREFARDLKSAKRAASEGPVVITTRGKPEFALLSYRAFEQLRGDAAPPSLWQVLSELPTTEGIEFDPPHLNIELRIPDFDTEEEPGSGH